MNVLHRPTFAEQSAHVVFNLFFALVKATLVALVLIVSALVAGQSRIAPISVRLLTTYGIEYDVIYFKPYRGYFPQPYAVNLTKK